METTYWIKTTSASIHEMIKRWPWPYSWVDWKFSFELISFPVFYQRWMIIMITYACLRPHPHVSGYFWIRKLFFPDLKVCASTHIRIRIESPVHTYPDSFSSPNIIQQGMRSTKLTGSLAASLYSCRTTWGFLSSSVNISLYCLQHATAKAEYTKNEKSSSLTALFGPMTRSNSY